MSKHVNFMHPKYFSKKQILMFSTSNTNRHGITASFFSSKRAWALRSEKSNSAW